MCEFNRRKVLLLTHALNLNIPGVQRDYCQWEEFTASCSQDTVIIIELARYGRMKFGRCIKYNLGYIGCSIDVLDIADLSCSGRTRCQIGVPNAYLDSVKPCLSELKAYLTASYRCQKGLFDSTFNKHTTLDLFTNVISANMFLSHRILFMISRVLLAYPWNRQASCFVEYI